MSPNCLVPEKRCRRAPGPRLLGAIRRGGLWPKVARRGCLLTRSTGKRATQRQGQIRRCLGRLWGLCRRGESSRIARLPTVAMLQYQTPRPHRAIQRRPVIGGAALGHFYRKASGVNSPWAICDSVLNNGASVGEIHPIVLFPARVGACSKAVLPPHGCGLACYSGCRICRVLDKTSIRSGGVLAFQVQGQQLSGREGPGTVRCPTAGDRNVPPLC